MVDELLNLSDYRGMPKWFGAHYNQEVRYRSAVKFKKGLHVRCLIKDKIIIITRTGGTKT